mmetsp:Transcript_54183/g.117060  ORF Transcript_54183/g.117060 Transcript_54183/m.117060 type:complete len:236 (-) Transcript_54183:626-1333(-)
MPVLAERHKGIGGLLARHAHAGPVLRRVSTIHLDCSAVAGELHKAAVQAVEHLLTVGDWLRRKPREPDPDVLRLCRHDKALNLARTQFTAALGVEPASHGSPCLRLLLRRDLPSFETVIVQVVLLLARSWSEGPVRFGRRSFLSDCGLVSAGLFSILWQLLLLFFLDIQGDLCHVLVGLVLIEVLALLFHGNGKLLVQHLRPSSQLILLVIVLRRRCWHSRSQRCLVRRHCLRNG